MEKDLGDAHISTSSEFLAVTNHDVALEELDGKKTDDLTQRDTGFMAELLEDSVERKECLVGLWNQRRGKATKEGVSVEQIKRWLRTYPVRNECTHFSCIMDPSRPGGGLRWAETFDGIIPQDVEGNTDSEVDSLLR